MGTSASKRDAPPASPLIPPWADQDPPVPPEDDPPEEPVPEPDKDEEDAPPAEPDEDEDDEPAPPAHPPVGPPPALPRRYNAFRRRLRAYMETGDREEARKALGHWVRTSMGGPRAGTQRLSRAIRLASSAFAGIARAGGNQAPNAGDFDVRGLAGLPSEIAIGRIVDAFCPPGITDEDAVRSAVGEALASALAGADTFDPAAIDENTVRLAVLGFVAEIVFVTVASDSKDVAATVTPAVAIERENGLRDLIREVADLIGTPLLVAAGALLTTAAVTNITSEIITQVQAEIATWI